LKACPHEAHVSAEPDPAQTRPRLPISYEDEGRPGGAEAPSGKGAQALGGVYSVEVVVPGPTGRFRRQHRLLRSREFRNVLQRGRRTTARAFVVFFLTPDLSQAPVAEPRLGITVSRKVGNAVARNRIKRCVREWFRGQAERLAPGSELVVIGRRGAAELSGGEIAAQLDDAIGRAS
jgi:ribonuclease P protein component